MKDAIAFKQLVETISNNSHKQFDFLILSERKQLYLHFRL